MSTLLSVTTISAATARRQGQYETVVSSSNWLGSHWVSRAQSRTGVRFDPPEDALLILLSVQARRECRKTSNLSTLPVRADSHYEVLTCVG